jgi:hypothetical protein
MGSTAAAALSKLMVFLMSLCAGCITHGWKLGRQTLPFWSHWILEAIYSGYPVTASSALPCLATVGAWYAPF